MIFERQVEFRERNPAAQPRGEGKVIKYALSAAELPVLSATVLWGNARVQLHRYYGYYGQ